MDYIKDYKCVTCCKIVFYHMAVCAIKWTFCRRKKTISMLFYDHKCKLCGIVFIVSAVCRSVVECVKVKPLQVHSDVCLFKAFYPLFPNKAYSHFKETFFTMQTRLLCTSNKASLRCKQGFFFNGINKA